MKLTDFWEFLEIFLLPSRSLTASFPLTRYRAPIGKDRLPSTIFQGRAVKFRESRPSIYTFCRFLGDVFCTKIMKSQYGCFQKIGVFTPKMHGLFHGKAYEQIDDLGGKPPLFLVQHPYVPGSKLLVLGMVIPPLIGNPYNGYINPYCWVDDHPLP